MKPSNALIGAAGEYYVAAELSRRGWLATVTIKNSPGTDVLALRLDDGLSVSVQTKTTTGSKFTLAKKDERVARGSHEWFALVALGRQQERPTFYLLPRDVAAGLIFASHRHWIATPGRGGQPHADTSMRNIWPRWIDRFEERWDLLEGPTTKCVDWVNPGWVTAALDHGLQTEMPTHPWIRRSKGSRKPKHK